MPEFYVHATASYCFKVEAESEADALNDVRCDPNHFAYFHKQEPGWEVDDAYPVKKKGVDNG